MIFMAERKKEAERPGKMSVAEAGSKGGQRVRELIRKGAEARERMVEKKK